jgi:GTPase SAR1 family protein/outer membrane protein assembly factor BamD (BamD/ComL family)
MNMNNRPLDRLDALETRLSGPKQIALFGHRNVGKTTLLAMFYRQASSGRIAGLRLAAADTRSAEYLAEKIAQLESGQPMAGSLAETELKLRLYHGPARFDLIVKDYQGEHVTLGTEEPIQEFFAGCDAVLLCLDPEGSPEPAERRRRQQEVENLLERYIDRSDDLSMGRPVALVLTKFDRVLANRDTSGDGTEIVGRFSPEFVEQLVNERFGMTRHALAEHAPEGAIFAVSSFGASASGNRPPTELDPMGLEGPLSWVAEQLEARDRADMIQLWELAPRDLPRLERCVAAYERRYPRSNRSYEFRGRIKKLARQRRVRWAIRGVAAGLLALGLLAGSDLLAYYRAISFERTGDSAAPAVARRWSELLERHPSLPTFWPALARQARLKRAQWQVKAADVQVANGTAPIDLHDRLDQLKDQTPQLAPAIRKVEAAQEQVRHDERWKTVYAEAQSLAAIDDPGAPLSTIDAFLRAYPDTPRRAEALALARSLKAELALRRSAVERRIVDDLIHAESLPNVSLSDQIERARQFLTDHPESPIRPEVERRLEGYLHRLDDHDIDLARDYSRQYPTQFATRIERYQDYLKQHQTGGRFISEAVEAKDHILREWDSYAFRQAYDHAIAHPDDVAEVAHRLRDYLRDHADGRYATDAQHYLDWWDKVSVPGQYRVTLRRGEVESTVGKYLAGGAPDLGVVIEVAGTVYGPTSVIRDSYRPIWDYTFSQPITWKLGDPVTIRIIDYDWSASEVYSLHSPEGDPLAMKLLSGTIKPSKGGKTSLVFSSDFSIPTLGRPE